MRSLNPSLVTFLWYDIMIYSWNERDHKENLRQVFEVLRGQKLYAKIEKY